MKRLAFVCLVLMTGTIALAQQPAEWRPNIAEDNKAASLSDTLDFLASTVRLARTDRAGCDSKHCDASENITLSSSGSCDVKLNLDTTAAESDGPFTGNDNYYTFGEYAINLRLIDPLAIRVVPNPKDASGGGYQLILEGTRNQSFASATVTSMWGLHTPPDKAAEAVASCSPKRYHCTQQKGGEIQLAIGNYDSETAKRLTRAFMHAALLCGGTKAVSPF
jgi:hypothetical protein